MRFVSLATLTVFFGVSFALPAYADPQSDKIVAKYLDAVGGPEAWAAGHGEYVLAKVQDPRFPLPGTFEFCWSWDKAKTADRSRFQGVTQLRVFTGGNGWTFMKPSGPAPGQLTDWDQARRDRGQDEWNGNIEILTHRLAKRDPAVTTRMGADDREGWVEISVDGRVYSYLLVNEDGSPKSFYRQFDDVQVNFGPLVDRGNVRFFSTGAFEGGGPFDVIAFEILDKAPIKPFIKPDANDPAYLECR